MTAHAFTFDRRDGHTLAARLELPSGGIGAVALFAYCFTCTMKSHAATRVTAALAAQGIAPLRFDFTGLGGSEDDVGVAGFAADVSDIVAAADHQRETIDTPAILIGHSLDGAGILAAWVERYLPRSRDLDKGTGISAPDVRLARAPALAGAL